MEKVHEKGQDAAEKQREEQEFSETETIKTT